MLVWEVWVIDPSSLRYLFKKRWLLSQNSGFEFKTKFISLPNILIFNSIFVFCFFCNELCRRGRSLEGPVWAQVWSLLFFFPFHMWPRSVSTQQRWNGWSRYTLLRENFVLFQIIKIFEISISNNNKKKHTDKYNQIWQRLNNMIWYRKTFFRRAEIIKQKEELFERYSEEED